MIEAVEEDGQGQAYAKSHCDGQEKNARLGVPTRPGRHVAPVEDLDVGYGTLFGQLRFFVAALERVVERGGLLDIAPPAHLLDLSRGKLSRGRGG